MQIRRGSKWLGILLVTVFLFLCEGGVVQAGIEENPYVTLSPDETAYTIQAGEKTTEWYKYGTVVDTGVKSTLPTLQKGEHLYDCEIDGLIPIEKWVVSQAHGICIHRKYPQEDTFHGVPFGRVVCKKPYFSGWFPLCANCNEVVETYFFYMSDDAAASMKYIDTSKAYYYKCPHCDNLEQGVELAEHICKKVSKNRYYVHYDANEGNGFMAKSVHMYDDAESYEGREVTPQTTLSLNTYHRIGYIFSGWNTRADGSGVFYEDGATIHNMTEEEGAEVVLYAQWKKCQSILQMDPAGGKLYGETHIVEQKGAYGEVYELPEEEVIPPMGFEVTFDTLGGSVVAPIRGTRHLVEWKKETPFCGEWKGNTYIFSNKENIVDKISAVYAEDAIVLPNAKRDGYSFGGWYLDREGTRRIGTAGDEFVPGRDIILYAGWVELQLEAEDNYVANGGKGAVDLSWMQKDTAHKLYSVYQRKEGEEWSQIKVQQEQNSLFEADIELNFCGETQVYTVPYTGIYKLSLYGAQGENYGEYQGGLGGGIVAQAFLEKGDRLQCIIGGHNGYGGGGNAKEYGRGGGATIIQSDKQGILLVAGGGGGALMCADGLPGGSMGSIVPSSNGEDGLSGGGGGYLGGKAGNVIVHTHDASCSHIHTGVPTEFGGCYTIPVLCEGKSFSREEIRRVFYYGNIADDGSRIYCARCGSYECPGHLDVFYGYTCQSCKKVYDKQVEVCTEVSAYALECEDAVYCGYEENEIIEISAAHGGSNYINPDYCFNYQEFMGVWKGDGKAYIAAEIIGILGETEMSGVPAMDCAPPHSILRETVVQTGISEREIRLSFEKPQDKGTVYYHKVESFDEKTGYKLCTSNLTENTLSTGVVGYYYVVDSVSNTVVNQEDNYLSDASKRPFLILNPGNEMQYLHIAPVDKAGNLGEVLHIEIKKDEINNWPLLTEKIVIQSGINVKTASAEDVYYVKADGVTPFQVECEGYVYGSASPKYQITHISVQYKTQIPESGGVFTVITPKQDVFEEGATTYPMRCLQKRVEGKETLTDAGYTVTKRYNYGKNILLLQQFILSREMDGNIIQLTPRVAVQMEQGFTYSQEELDAENSICLIADGKGPKIEGIEQLDKIQYLDFAEGENMWVTLSAQDEGSGLAKFYVEIRNMDNGTILCYEDTMLTGRISFEVSQESMAFNGEFQIMVVAKDYVGNETVEGAHLLGVGLQTYVERILEPHDAGFKRGESGLLHIRTTGYVERVEVLLPQMLVREGEQSNLVYVYEMPEYMQTEDWEFIVPLTAGDGVCTIQVKAYKAGTELEKQPQFLTIEVKGSILDELRTRLR